MTQFETSVASTVALSSRGKSERFIRPAGARRAGKAVAMGAFWVGGLSLLLGSSAIFLHVMGQVAVLCPNHLPC